MVKVVSSPNGLPQWPDDSIGGDRFLTEVARDAKSRSARAKKSKLAPKLGEVDIPSPQKVEGGEELPEVDL